MFYLIFMLNFGFSSRAHVAVTVGLCRNAKVNLS
jgi:hypothetical protein